MFGEAKLVELMVKADRLDPRENFVLALNGTGYHILTGSPFIWYNLRQT